MNLWPHKHGQRTRGWYMQRLGIPTASCYKLVIAEGEGITRYAYMQQLLEERLTGIPTIVRPYNDAMKKGPGKEPLASLRYHLLTGKRLEPVGFFRHHRLNTGASPDRKIAYYNGGLEIKCPDEEQHYKNCFAAAEGRLPGQYRAQVQGELMNTGWDFIDFMSFNDSVRKEHQVAGVRIYRDELYIQMLESKLEIFIDELESLEKQARRMGYATVG